MGEAIRILIADDHPVVRYGLTHLLSADPEFAVVGEAASTDEVVERLQTLKPDVTVLDMGMGGSWRPG
jgi:DNA-binding NarL/FixJ family response regulator